ncbi:MAG TPA: TrkA C-terminal domain-containing protein, partial [Nitrolancea sp.]|nr:TrkA C-terminal domain-containing protein [Nitrolancea sp.]
MTALISFLAIVAVSLLFERIAAVALAMTGLPRDVAAFQAWSAFTGTGFTTSEAELVTGHPVRRRIVMLLMALRSLGIISAVPSFALSFMQPGSVAQGVARALWLIVGLIVLGVLFTNPSVDRHLSSLIRRVLLRWTHVDGRDYTALLGLKSGYGVLEVPVQPGSWLANRRLKELDLPEEGVVVLGIQRADGSFNGAPQGYSEIRPQDTLILYGRKGYLSELGRRPGGSNGDQAHRDAVREQQSLLQEQDR